jgi:hypothetical protein
MRLFIAATLTVAIGAVVESQDKTGTPVELAGMKSTTPANWKEEPPSNSLRIMQFKLPKAEGDADDAELALFKLAGAGSVQDNLKRQEAKFELPAGKKAEDVTKIEKIKLGSLDAIYQDIQGTYLKKFPPAAPNAKITKMPEYRQLYVIFEAKSGDSTVLYSMTLLGPIKTVEKHKKEFDEWLKNFK